MILGLFIEIIPSLLFLIGIYICIKGIKQGSRIHRTILWFFIFFLVNEIYALVYRLYSDDIISYLNNADVNVSKVIYYISLPPTLLKIAAFFILTVALFRSLKR